LRSYEILLMYPGTLGPEEVDHITKRVFDQASSLGVELENIERWPKRRFAYEVKHHTEGYYCDVKFKATPEGLRELDRLFRLEDSVLRHKVTSRVEKTSKTSRVPVTPPDSTDSKNETN